MEIISEGPVKITKATITSCWKRKKSKQRILVRDLECRGLALIVNSTSMVWSYAYRPRGTDPATGRRWPNRSVTLGNPETHSPEDARIEANLLKGQTAAGNDPAAIKRARAAEDQKRRGATLGRLLDEYEDALPNRPKMRGNGTPSAKYVAEEIAHTRMALSDIDAIEMPATELGVSDVKKLLTGKILGTTSPRTRFGALSRFCDWLHDCGQISVNPCSQVPRSRRPKAPLARSEYFTPAELTMLWHAAEKLEHQVWRDLVRFLIAMPCRRGEAAKMEWAHIDLEAGEWRHPVRTTKNGDPHRLLLHPLALGILKDRQQASDGRGLVFPAPRSGKVVDTFSDIKNDLRVILEQDQNGANDGVKSWRWHDLRRSFASALGEAGVQETIADAILNHRQAATRGGVLGVYQRSSRFPEQAKAMREWGNILAAAIEASGAEKPPMPH